MTGAGARVVSPAPACLFFRAAALPGREGDGALAIAPKASPRLRDVKLEKNLIGA